MPVMRTVATYDHGGGVRGEQYAKLLKILSVVCRD